MEKIRIFFSNNKLYVLVTICAAFVLGFFVIRSLMQRPRIVIVNCSADECLKDAIVTKYARGTVLDGHTSTVSSVAFSPDGSKIVSCGIDPNNNLILWDVSDIDNVTRMMLIFYSDMVNSVAF